MAGGSEGSHSGVLRNFGVGDTRCGVLALQLLETPDAVGGQPGGQIGLLAADAREFLVCGVMGPSRLEVSQVVRSAAALDVKQGSCQSPQLPH